MLYYKKHGRRYVPIAETIDMYAYKEGNYIVSIKPGIQSIAKVLDPDYATVSAAIKEFRDELSAKLDEASRLKLADQWEAGDKNKRQEAHAKLKTLMDEIGTDVLWQDSPNAIIDAVAETLEKKIHERHVAIESDELILAAFKALLTRYCLVTGVTSIDAVEIVKNDLVDIGVLPENVSIRLA